MIECIVSVSGGACSAVALMRAVEKYGTDQVKSIFMDTKSEDADLYRFIKDVDAYLGVATEVLADGRDIWQVAKDVRFIPNTRIDPCSRILKREQFYAYADGYPRRVVLAYGFSAEEFKRSQGLKRRVEKSGRKAWFPLLDEPEVFSQDAKDLISSTGLKLPRLYQQGFSHNNCGGFCFKAGQKQFANLLRVNPTLYDYHEQKEQELQAHIGTTATILRDRRGGPVKPLTLKQLRVRIEQKEGYDESDQGSACDCMGLDSHEQD